MALDRVDAEHPEAEVGGEPEGMGALAAPDVDHPAVRGQAQLAHDLEEERRVARRQALVQARGEGSLTRMGVVEELPVPGHGPSLPHRAGRAREAQ